MEYTIPQLTLELHPCLGLAWGLWVAEFFGSIRRNSRETQSEAGLHGTSRLEFAGVDGADKGILWSYPYVWTILHRGLPARIIALVVLLVRLEGHERRWLI